MRLAPRLRSLLQAPFGAQAAVKARSAPSWLRCPRCCSFRAPANVTHWASAARSAARCRDSYVPVRGDSQGAQLGRAVGCYGAAITRPLPAAALLAGLRHASLEGRDAPGELPRQYGSSIVAERGKVPFSYRPWARSPDKTAYYSAQDDGRRKLGASGFA